jgi:hypothetical protein
MVKKNTDSYYIGKERTTMRLLDKDKEIVDKDCDKRQITLLVYFEESVKRNIKYWSDKIEKVQSLPNISRNANGNTNSTVWLSNEDKMTVDVSCANRKITLLSYLEESVKLNIKYWAKRDVKKHKKKE